MGTEEKPMTKKQKRKKAVQEAVKALYADMDADPKDLQPRPMIVSDLEARLMTIIFATGTFCKLTSPEVSQILDRIK